MSLYRGVIPENRVLSIDALRGFDMFLIIGGGAFISNLLRVIDTPFNQAIFSQMHHAEWHGFTAWDLIFPLFLYIVGASMPFSLSGRLEKGDSRKNIYHHIVKRAIILYFFGMIIEAGRINNFGGLRYTGVLHRIAFCYLFASLIVMNTRVAGQALWAVFLLIFYWVIMTFVPVPGYGSGVFTPEGNLASYVDRLFLPGILYHDVFDNEGILSTVPAISTTLLGVLSGHWLRSSFLPGRKSAGLCAVGVLSLILGLLWNMIFPINKLIWTSSYVLYSGGWSMLLLGIFYWIIDVRGYRTWAFPFVVIGLNAITIYMAGSLFDFGRIVAIFTYEFIDILKSLQPLFRASSILFVKWLFLYYLYRKKLFLKV
ncbi:acyltransferase family protein [Candidatus Latescibacterota bacterium]